MISGRYDFFWRNELRPPKAFILSIYSGFPRTVFAGFPEAAKNQKPTRLYRMPHRSFHHGDRGDKSKGSSQATLTATAMTAEKGHTTETSVEASGTSTGSHASEPEENVVREKDLSAGDGLYARLHRFAGRFGVEERGIERVPRDERPNIGMSQVGLTVRKQRRHIGLSGTCADNYGEHRSGHLQTWSRRHLPLAFRQYPYSN